MVHLSEIEELPTFVALETLPVLAGQKRGASIQLPDTYFDNSVSVLNALDEREFDERVETLRVSHQILTDVEIAIDAVEVAPLRAAAEELHDTYRDLAEVDYLRAGYPGDCIVVPEFLRTADRIRFGTRVYFFRENEAPAPTEIIDRNINAVVADAQRSFDRYQGDLHGYPECCIAHFLDRGSHPPSPELRAVAPLASHIREDLLRSGPDTSIEEIVPDFFDANYAHSFFSREFFPKTECSTAGGFGKEVYDVLVEDVNETLARDCFRLNYALCYVLARSQLHGSSELPHVGVLGTEHAYSYLPLHESLTLPRYT